MTDLIPVFNRLIDVGFVVLIVIGVFFAIFFTGLIAFIIHGFRHWR